MTVARTLKYAWAVPVGKCYTIWYFYFTEIKPSWSAEQCADSIIYFSWACLSASSCSYLSILALCAVLSALTCLFCPVYPVLYFCFSCLFHSSHSLLAFMSWLSCLNYHFVLFPDHSYPTILLSCPFFLSSLFCSFALSWSFLSCLYCPALDILYGLLFIQGFYETVIPSCLPCPSLHSFLSSPVFFRFYHSVQYFYLYFLAALYFLDFLFWPSCPDPSLLFAFPVSTGYFA